jgi:hypothetical protein
MRSGYCAACNEPALLVTEYCSKCEFIYGEKDEFHDEFSD